MLCCFLVFKSNNLVRYVRSLLLIWYAEQTFSFICLCELVQKDRNVIQVQNKFNLNNLIAKITESTDNGVA